ncbi:hypothetical protein EDS67_14325 [candidate division KSB1 bacterium]|nr:MAG: hypothetical protein EDS67_14325 [candidate division KSB1 bacterium]MBC6947111.1 hypothetical protein [candidate division KSB1 bacterium]MCE7941053.1 hypothetical protein [Chlorobi bacterium CHB1]
MPGVCRFAFLGLDFHCLYNAFRQITFAFAMQLRCISVLAKCLGDILFIDGVFQQGIKWMK